MIEFNASVLNNKLEQCLILCTDKNDFHMRDTNNFSLHTFTNKSNCLELMFLLFLQLSPNISPRRFKSKSY